MKRTTAWMQEVEQRRSSCRGALSNLNARTPYGDDVTQRTDPKPAFSYDLFEQVLRPENFRLHGNKFEPTKEPQVLMV